MPDLKISALVDLATPDDADLVPVVDTSATTTKKSTWANIKATLKAYFDTLYAAIGSVVTINATNGVLPQRSGAGALTDSPITGVVPGSMVNGITVTGGATGTSPIIASTGSDANLNLNLNPKGTGFTLVNLAAAGGEFTVRTFSGPGDIFTATDSGSASGQMRFLGQGASFDVSGFQLGQIPIKWNGTNYWATAADTGLDRNAAGVVEVNNGTAGAWRDLKVRKHYVDQTITAGGTTGNQTINKAAGTVNIAAAGTSVTVTNNLVTTSSLVFVVIRTNDGTATIKNVVPSNGSFVINLAAAATAEISIGFFVLN